MESIGIKLADGSFYPILQQAGQKILDVTTVKDNQTTVQVDLYRSQTGTMQGAQYVDTLRIKNFPPSKEGKPTMNLSVSLDKNNMLSAHIIDKDSGLHSDTQIELTTLTGQTQIQEPTQDANAKADFTLPPLDSLEDFKSEPLPPAPIQDAQDIEDPSKDIATNDIVAKDSVVSANDFGDLSTLPDFDLPKLDDNKDAPFSDSFFDMPDFDAPKTNNLDGYLNDPVFDSPDFVAPDISSLDIDENSEKDKKNDATPSPAFSDMSGSAMDFSGLYDKETLEGNSATTDEQNSYNKKGLCVAICVICALICLCTTAILLLVVPSKYNLLAHSKQKTQQQLQKTNVPPPPPAPPIKELAPLPPIEPVVQVAEPVKAQEDKIVVSPTPKIIPETPKPKPQTKATAAPQTITYKIKWGDTLWDLSNTYYRTPWKYPKIAKYNGIKNPDIIISGTKIQIPKE